jgi:potassium efflux system protein
MEEETSPSLLNSLKFQDVLHSIQDDVVKLAAEFVSYASLWQFLAIVIAGIAGFFLSRVPVTRLKKLAASRERPDVLFHAADFLCPDCLAGRDRAPALGHDPGL